jgi:hypothetical protein
MNHCTALIFYVNLNDLPVKTNAVVESINNQFKYPINFFTSTDRNKAGLF